MVPALKTVLIVGQRVLHLVESIDGDRVFGIDFKRGNLTSHISARLLIDVIGVIAALVLHFKHCGALIDLSQLVGSTSVRCRGRYGVNAVAFVR